MTSKALALLALIAAFACNRKTTPETVAPASLEADGKIELLLYEPTGKAAPTDTCDVSLCKSLVGLIDGATSTIDFAIYGMRNQSQVLEALKNAKARGVKVRGIVDRDRNGKNIYSSTDKLIETVGGVESDQKADEKLAKQKAREGFGGTPRCDRPEGTKGPVQCLAYDLGDSCLLAAHASRETLGEGDPIMHDKFFVVDNKALWTGSTNVSDSCSGGYNANLVIVAHSQKLARWYTEEFEQMYRGKYHTLKQQHGPQRVELANAEVELRFSPQDDPIRDGVRPLLKHARSKIDIAVFFLTHKHVAEDLIAAHQRGVKIRVLIDSTGARNEYSKHELLRAAGIAVKVENWGGKMHMKSAAVDGQVVIAGSMNWTSSGEYNNDENTMLIRSPELATQYHAFFERTWAAMPDTLLTLNPDPESQISSTACSDGVDNDYDGGVDMADPGCAASPPPVPGMLPWRIVPKAGRLTCDIEMPGEAVRRSNDEPNVGAVAPVVDGEQIEAD